MSAIRVIKLSNNDAIIRIINSQNSTLTATINLSQDGETDQIVEPVSNAATIGLFNSDIEDLDANVPPKVQLIEVLASMDAGTTMNISRGGVTVFASSGYTKARKFDRANLGGNIVVTLSAIGSVTLWLSKENGYIPKFDPNRLVYQHILN